MKGGNPIGTYPNFSFARVVAKKPTFLRLRGSFEYEIQSRKYSIPLFFTTQGFDTFRNREISTGASAIREQLADPDLRFLLDSSLVEWKYLGEEGKFGSRLFMHSFELQSRGDISVFRCPCTICAIGLFFLPPRPEA